MKRLALLRHAKSSWHHHDVDDLGRPLNDRGWKAARRIGKELKHRHMRFDLVIASTAARVRETIDGVQEHFDFECEIRFEPELYLASCESLFSMIAALPDSVKAPLLVGHNPGLQQLLFGLARDDDPLRHRIAHKFPTGALGLIALPADRWREIALSSGEIVDLILPKELD